MFFTVLLFLKPKIFLKFLAFTSYFFLHINHHKSNLIFAPIKMSNFASLKIEQELMKDRTNSHSLNESIYFSSEEELEEDLDVQVNHEYKEFVKKLKRGKCVDSLYTITEINESESTCNSLTQYSEVPVSPSNVIDQSSTNIIKQSTKTYNLYGAAKVSSVGILAEIWSLEKHLCRENRSDNNIALNSDSCL